MSLIFLIGMPGSGKSSAARLWSKSYNWQMTDMDTELERRHGNIARLFENRGEDFFRKEETALLEHIIAAGPSKMIIATGGGTPCFYNNLDRMKKAGCVIYLQATATELNAHLAHSAVVRPLLKGNRAEQISRLLKEREAIYREAHFTYRSVSVTGATFAEIIDACTNRHL